MSSLKPSHVLFRSGLIRYKKNLLNQSKNMDKYNDLINNTMQKHYYHNEEENKQNEEKKRELKPPSSSLSNKTSKLISDSIQKYYDKKDGKKDNKENDKKDKSDSSSSSESESNDNLNKKSNENIPKIKSNQLNFLNGRKDELIKNSFQQYAIEKKNNKRKKQEDSSDDDEISSSLPRRRVRTFREFHQEKKKASKYKRDIEREKEEEKFKCKLYNIPYEDTEDSSFVVYEKSEYNDNEFMSSDREDTSAFLRNNPSFIDDECEEGEETGSIKGDFSDSEEEKMYRDAVGDNQDSFYENNQYTDEDEDSMISEEEFSRRIKRKANQFVFDEVDVDGEDLHTDDIDHTENEVPDSFIVDDDKDLTIDETNSDLNSESFSNTNIYSSPPFNRKKKRRVAKLNDTEENLTITNLNNSIVNGKNKSPDKNKMNTILLEDSDMVLDNNELKTINLSDTHLNQNLSAIDETLNKSDILSDNSLNQQSQTIVELNNNSLISNDDNRNIYSNSPKFSSDDEEDNNWTKIGKKSKFQRIESDDESNKEEVWLSAKKKSVKNTSLESNNEYKNRLRKRTTRALFLETDDESMSEFEEIGNTKRKSKKSLKIESDDESMSGNEKIDENKFKTKKSLKIESDDEFTLSNEEINKSKFKTKKKSLKIESDDESMSGNEKEIVTTRSRSKIKSNDKISDNKKLDEIKSKKRPIVESDDDNSFITIKKKSTRPQIIESDNNEEIEKEITINKLDLMNSSSRNDDISVECIFTETTNENIETNSFDLDTSNDLEEEDTTLT